MKSNPDIVFRMKLKQRNNKNNKEIFNLEYIETH